MDKLIESAAGQKTLDIKRLIGALRHLGSEPARDRESAEQLAAAIDVVIGELNDPANAAEVREVDPGAIDHLRMLAEKLQSKQ